MSHIHIPDGVLPLWLWVLGYILIGIYFIFAALYVTKYNKQSKLPLISVMTALMLLTMSVPIPFPVPYHINLAVLAGIILGPVLSFFAIFTSNLLLAFTSHGGITVIGLNTLVISIEAALGYLIFRFIYKKSNKIFLSTFIATFSALIISAIFTIGIVYAGTHNFSSLAHNECHQGCNTIEHKASVHHDEKHIDEETIALNDKHIEHDQDEENFNIKKFLSIMLIFGFIGWLLESALTGFIVSYIKKVKADILNL